jgi:hypothetical protein
MQQCLLLGVLALYRCFFVGYATYVAPMAWNMLPLCCSMVASMAWTMWRFHGLSYEFAYACFFYTVSTANFFAVADFLFLCGTGSKYIKILVFLLCPFVADWVCCHRGSQQGLLLSSTVAHLTGSLCFRSLTAAVNVRMCAAPAMPSSFLPL